MILRPPRSSVMVPMGQKSAIPMGQRSAIVAAAFKETRRSFIP